MVASVVGEMVEEIMGLNGGKYHELMGMDIQKISPFIPVNLTIPVNQSLGLGHNCSSEKEESHT